MKMRISIKWMSSCMGVLLYAWKPIQFAGFSTAACVLDSECGRREAILLEEWLSILLKANASLGRKTR